MTEAQDPRWREISASLRKGKLFVKMPISRAWMLTVVLRTALGKCDEALDPIKYLKEDLLGFLVREIDGARELEHRSIFYQVPEETGRKDVALLREHLEPSDNTHEIRYFCEVLEAGLNGNPGVDWISRVGGPKSSTPSLDLDLAMDDIEINLDDVLDDIS
jgi:hypothetical protein